MSSGAGGLPPGTKAIKAGGQILVVPQNMSQEEILGLLDKGVMSGEMLDAPKVPDAGNFKGPVTREEAIGAGTTQGFTLGWGDEVAAGLGPATNEEIKSRESVAAANYPTEYYGGMAAGTVAGIPLMPVTAGARGVQAAVGGVTGAVAGFGEGDTPGERIKNAAIGGTAGAIGGAISPEVAVLATKVAGKLRQPVDFVLQKLGLSGAASEIAAGLKNRGLTAEQAEQMILDAAERGQPATLGDVAPTELGRLAQRSANRSTTAQSELGASQAGKVGGDEAGIRWRNFLADQSSAGGGATTHEAREALLQRARDTNELKYGIATTDPTPIWDAELKNMVSSPAGKAAIADMDRIAANRAAARGQQNSFVNPWDAEGNLKNPNMPPTVEAWDMWQRSMQRQIENADKAKLGGGLGPEGSDLASLKRNVLDRVDAASPTFKEARTGASGFFGEENALDVGKMLGKGEFKGDAEAFQKAEAQIAKMTPGERELLKQGYLDTVSYRSGNTDVGNPAIKAMGSHNDRTVAKLVLGEERGQKLMDFADVERGMKIFHQAATGGPSTARQAFDLMNQGALSTAAGGAAGAAAFLSQGGDKAITAGAAAAAAVATSLAKAGLSEIQARTLVRLIQSDKPEVRQRVYNLMGHSKRVHEAVVKTMTALGAAEEKARSAADGEER